MILRFVLAVIIGEQFESSYQYIIAYWIVLGVSISGNHKA